MNESDVNIEWQPSQIYHTAVLSSEGYLSACFHLSFQFAFTHRFCERLVALKGLQGGGAGSSGDCLLESFLAIDREVLDLVCTWWQLTSDRERLSSWSGTLSTLSRSLLVTTLACLLVMELGAEVGRKLFRGGMVWAREWLGLWIATSLRSLLW